jgi:hypothetical protein
MRVSLLLLAGAVGVALLACGEEQKPAPAPAATAPAPTAALPSSPPAPTQPAPPELPKGLLVALSQFEVTPEGKVLPKPGAARLEFLVRRGGKWQGGALDDPESNVFHKAMVYTPPGGAPGILTIGGMAAAVKLWRAGEGGALQAETLWKAEFGGKFNRMRDAEIGDLSGNGKVDLAVATHDQGVVAIVRAKPAGGYAVEEIDREKDTFAHEIELGDLDGDGTPEVYATPSEPNRLDGTPQSGHVVRYVPAREGGVKEGRVVVADLGQRHAKEIWVGDADGDGRDELYVSVEAETEGEKESLRIKEPVEIRRYDAGTDPAARNVIATIEDRLCRFLTVGDVDGDGKKEMVAAAFRSGLWLLRPGADPKGRWTVAQIDRSSSGFEHAALLTDLDGDGKDELYVASDDQGEIRRYTWTGSAFARETIFTRKVKGSAFTWNLTPVPAELVPRS